MDVSLTTGLSFNDLATATRAKVRQGPSTDRVAISERVVIELIRAANRRSVSHSITVAPTIAPTPARAGMTTGTVSQTIKANTSRTRSLTDTLGITSRVSAFLATSQWVDPSVTAPSPTGSIVLSYPGESTVTLRSPDFGDSDLYEAFRVSRTSRGGTVQVYQDPMWPTTEVLSFQFSFLDGADALLDFLKATVGGKITLVDHYGRTWEGFIITPAGDVIQDKRTTFTAAFKFQVAPA